jgi:hypothetical protein
VGKNLIQLLVVQKAQPITTSPCPMDRIAFIVDKNLIQPLVVQKAQQRSINWTNRVFSGLYCYYSLENNNFNGDLMKDPRQILKIVQDLMKVLEEIKSIDGLNLDLAKFINCAYLQDIYISPEICAILVKINGATLYLVPKEFRTAEVCKNAIENHGRSFKFIPPDFRTEEICKTAIQNGCSLGDIPDKRKTNEMCLLAVKDNGGELEYVPENLKTVDICKAAIANDEDSLEFVPAEIRGLLNNELEE